MVAEEQVRVDTLDVQCSLQLRNFRAPGLAMSDCCGKRATSAVETSRGMKVWRCEAHRGIVAIGPVHESITQIVQQVR